MLVCVLFCTWLVICLLAMCLCFCFVWAHGFVFIFCVSCALMSICLDPTHLVSWLLVNLSHLSLLVTLLICSLYTILVFAVLCQFVIECFLFLPCQALPAVLIFPYGVVLVCLFVLFIFPIKTHSLQYWVLASSLHHKPWQYPPVNQGKKVLWN